MNVTLKQLVTLGLLLAATLSGCQCDAPPSLKQDSTLHVIVSSAPESLDPRYVGSLVASNLSHLLFSSLFHIGEDLLPQPLLAEDVDQLDDLTYLVNLRPNLRFHDGSPLSADDVVYTFSSLGTEDVKSPEAEKFNYLEEAVALSPTQIRFKLKKPFAPFLIDLSSLSIVSKASCLGRSAKCRHEYVGAGPFKLTRYDKVNETLLLEPNPYWFEGPPPLKKIEIRVVRDATTRLLELIKGKADFCSGAISPTQLAVVEQYPEQLTLKRLPGLGYSYIAMNLRGPRGSHTGPESEQDRTRRALADMRVRQALAASIDINAILKAKFKGMATRAGGMIPPFHWAKPPELGLATYDPTKARTLLDQVGFFDRGVGKGGRFKLTLSTTNDRFRQSIALIYAHQFRAVGIDTHVRIQDWGSLYQDIKQGNFEMFSAMWTPVIEPDLMHWVFHSDNIPTPDKGGGNRGGYIDSLLDAMLDEARNTTDLEKRRALYEQIERRLRESLPYIPLWFEDEVVVMSRDVLDFTPSRTGSLLGLRHTRIERTHRGETP